jgi:hypothetical protein
MYDDIIDQSTYYVYHCNDQSIVSRIIENKFTQCYSTSTWEYWFNSAFNYDFGSWMGYKIIDSNIVSPNGEKLRYGDGTLVNIYDIFEEDLENSLYFSN